MGDSVGMFRFGYRLLQFSYWKIKLIAEGEWETWRGHVWNNCLGYKNINESRQTLWLSGSVCQGHLSFKVAPLKWDFKVWLWDFLQHIQLHGSSIRVLEGTKVKVFTEYDEVKEKKDIWKGIIIIILLRIWALHLLIICFYNVGVIL